MTLVVVEPHSDDAFLSLGGHIGAWRGRGVEVVIVTVYGDAKRRAEAAIYAEKVGATQISIGLPEAGLGNGADWHAAELEPRFFESVVSLTGIDPAGWIWPLGIHHPEHRAVAALAPSTAHRYFELPYSVTTANAEETTRLALDRPVVSWMRPHARKYRHAPIFKTQALFMHYNGEKLHGAPELIVGGLPPIPPLPEDL